MNNYDHLSNIALLVKELIRYGIDTVIISPGSRNAPLSILFSSVKTCKTHVIVDERCAAFFALGMAQKLNKPVALLCTSGTASLNYSPAIAEAYYLQVPLLVLTADRPLKWLHHSEGQQINQTDIYRNFCADSFTFDTALNQTALQPIVKASLECLGLQSRPVHINIPIDEPLYNLEHLIPLNIKNRPFEPILKKTPFELNQKEIQSLNTSVFIIVGTCPHNAKLNSILNQLNKHSNVTVLSETTSNLKIQNRIQNLDLLLPGINNDIIDDLKPHILISIGTHFISKHLKQFLRANKPTEHWHINEFGFFPNTFEALTKRIALPIIEVLESIDSLIKVSDSTFAALWQSEFNKMLAKQVIAEQELAWCELKAFAAIYKLIPENSILHMGNSMSVRYSQYLPVNNAIEHYANRGTSGIDGSLSTAIGSAMADERQHTIILGDLSFMYDSNALWQEKLPDNLKIIILNNGGGSIFKFIKGPGNFEHTERIFQAKHNRNFKHIALQYNIPYTFVDNENELKNTLNRFYNREGLEILEICTNAELNTEQIKSYINKITQ